MLLDYARFLCGDSIAMLSANSINSLLWPWLIHFCCLSLFFLSLNPQLPVVPCIHQFMLNLLLSLGMMLFPLVSITDPPPARPSHEHMQIGCPRSPKPRIASPSVHAHQPTHPFPTLPYPYLPLPDLQDTRAKSCRSVPAAPTLTPLRLATATVTTLRS